MLLSSTGLQGGSHYGFQGITHFWAFKTSWGIIKYSDRMMYWGTIAGRANGLRQGPGLACIGVKGINMYMACCRSVRAGVGLAGGPSVRCNGGVVERVKTSRTK